MGVFSYRASNVVRAAIAMAAGGGDTTRAIQHAESKAVEWGDEPVRFIRAAVAPGATTTWPGFVESKLEFVEQVEARTLIGRIPFAAGVLNVKLARTADGGTAHFVGEGLIKTVTALQFVTVGTIEPHKCVGYVAVSDELLRRGGLAGERMILSALRNTCALTIDRALCDPANAGDGSTPPSIAYGVTPVPATPDFGEALQAAFAQLSHQADAVIAMSPATATKVAGLHATNGCALYPDLGPRGGNILGAPVYTSDGVPPGVVVIFDPSQIFVVNDGPTIDYASYASVDMGDGKLWSLFQANAHAWRVEMYPSWLVAGPGNVAVITGVSAA